MGRFVSVAWLAEKNNLDPSSIRQQIKWIKWDAFKIGHDWRIWIEAEEEEHKDVLRLTPVINKRGFAKKQYYINSKRIIKSTFGFV